MLGRRRRRPCGLARARSGFRCPSPLRVHLDLRCLEGCVNLGQTLFGVGGRWTGSLQLRLAFRSLGFGWRVRGWLGLRLPCCARLRSLERVPREGLLGA